MCESCVYAKQHKLKFAPIDRYKTKLGEQTFSDVCGPMSVEINIGTNNEDDDKNTDIVPAEENVSSELEDEARYNPINEELNSLGVNKTWELKILPRNLKIDYVLRNIRKLLKEWITVINMFRQNDMENLRKKSGWIRQKVEMLREE